MNKLFALLVLLFIGFGWILCFTAVEFNWIPQWSDVLRKVGVLWVIGLALVLAGAWGAT